MSRFSLMWPVFSHPNGSRWHFFLPSSLYKKYHPSFVNISPTVVIYTSMEMSSKSTSYSMETQKFEFFKFSQKFEIEFWLVPKSWNHPSFVNISPTLVIDTSMERSSRVLQHWKKNLIFFFLIFEIEFRLVFCLTFFLFKFEIEFWLKFWLVSKRWNHSSRSQQAPIRRHRGCIVVPSRVDI